MRYFLIISLVLLAACNRNKGPKNPGTATLEYPLQNSECSTGEDINDTTSRIEFRWKQANDTETYQLQVINLNSSITQTINTEALSARLTLEKGALYSWSITTKNSEVNQTTESDTWRFYNAGAQTTYAPFPAEIIEPTSGSTVFKDVNNDVLLDWSGADVDDDISEYNVYFSLTNPPEALLATLDKDNTSINTSVASNTVYFWRVVTTDEEGNSSDSGVYEFKVF